MKVAFEERSTATEYDVQADDTLESIADEQCPDIGGWQALARFNFGTDDKKEVLRALVETIGVKTAVLADVGFLNAPQTIKLAPDADLPHKLKIPKIWKKDGLALEKAHKIKARPLPKPATAVNILTLDKWFIPALEKCDIEYGLEGDGVCADTVQLDVFGNKYCECTALNNGLGTYGNPDDLIDTPIFTKDLAAQAEERETYGMPAGEDWKGESTATAGILSRKTGTAAERYINVAFSPYTVHFRYRKQSADGDKDARIILKPFWPQWEETKTEPAAAGAIQPGQLRVTWTNAAKADQGVLRVFDKKGQLVHLATIADDQLAAGNKQQDWNRLYRADAENSKFGRVLIDDSAQGVNSENAPYEPKVSTFVRTKVDASLEIKWEIKNTDRLKHGLLQITDGSGKLVFQKALPEADVASGAEKSFQWDGQYAEGIFNSKGDVDGGHEIIPEDMPYRVQIQAHTGVGETEGLALAAMHTEVRLYAHPETKAPKDLRYDPYYQAHQSMLLSLGPLVPGIPPAEGDGTKWYRYKLAEYGFHPGPVTDAAAANNDYHIALKEFKRSAPKKGDVAAPNFERLVVNTTENDETKTAIKTIRNSDKRMWFGSLARVSANSNTPDLNANEIRDAIKDPNADMIVWADDRQYYTAGETTEVERAKDENDRAFLTGTAEANKFSMDNYRGAMTILDDKNDADAASIPRPWIPLQVKLRLLSRTKGLYDQADVAVDPLHDQVMRHSLGPLRVDWTFDELPRDISTIQHRPPAGTAAYDNDYVRTRYYVNWAIEQKRAAYTRVDTGRGTYYTNCRGGADPNDLGGIRPDDGALNTYYQKAFGYDDLSLEPWRAAAVTATESTATVIHDHLVGAQTDHTTNLYGSLIGSAGVYFNPSRVAGDGYRARAEVKFEEFDNYEFPNLEALKARYPTLPQAHTARMRVWRRSSMRGNICWGPAASGHWPNYLAEFRRNYRAAHVYFVFENDADKVFDVAALFDPGTRAHRNRYKNIVRNNMVAGKRVLAAFASLNPFRDTSKMNLNSNYIWPWVHRSSVWPLVSTVNLAPNRAIPDVEGKAKNVWRSFRAGLLYAILKEIEKQGYLRGHLFAEFRSSPEYYAEEYRCGGSVTRHRYWYYRERTAAHGSLNGTRCPGPFCNGTGWLSRRSRLNATGRRRDPGWNPRVFDLPAVGVALGATWLWDDQYCTTETFTHEVGHHRHMEHAANGPGSEFCHPVGDRHANQRLHDTEDNTKIPDWNALGLGAHEDSEEHWDRRCMMSYNKDAPRYMCGKCILRNRGWKVQQLGFPGTDKTET